MEEIDVTLSDNQPVEVNPLSTEEKALLFINSQTNPQNIIDFIMADPNGNSSIGISKAEAMGIIELRQMMPEATISSLEVLLDVVSTATLQNIIYTFSIENEGEGIQLQVGGALLKSRLANLLEPFLSPKDKTTMIIGSQTVSSAVEFLSEVLGTTEAEEIQTGFIKAIEGNVIDPQIRVADIVYFPQISVFNQVLRMIFMTRQVFRIYLLTTVGSVQTELYCCILMGWQL